MNAVDLILSAVAYLFLLVGALFGLYTIWLLANLVMGSPVPGALIIVSLGGAVLATFMGWLVRLANSKPSHGGRQSVRDTWKQW